MDPQPNPDPLPLPDDDLGLSCSEELGMTVPRNAMLSMRALNALLPIQEIDIRGSARALVDEFGPRRGLDRTASLREATLRATPLAITVRADAINPPARFLETSSDPRALVGRLAVGLRSVAQWKDPRKILAEAVLQYDRDPALGQALADLAITGRSSYEQFAKDPLTEETLFAAVKARVADIYGGSQPVPDGLQNAISRVLDRAYQVAFALRGPYPGRAALRPTLGWIAVSGEDDPPHRPVNNGAAPYAQYEMPVKVTVEDATGGQHDVTVATRFFIASPASDELPTTPMPAPGRALAPEPVPVVPAGDRVLLFIHGHSSSAEEAGILIPWIHKEGLARGVRFSVVSMDLPSNAYSQMIDHTEVAPWDATTYPGGDAAHAGIPIKTPLLDYLEQFIVGFVDALDQRTPIKDRFAGVIGGSLGGSMGLRLGRLDLARHPWLANGIVSWSPASVWAPKAGLGHFDVAAPDHCRDKWREEEKGFSRVNYFRECFYGEIHDSQGARNVDKVLGELLAPAQANAWHRSPWKCSDTYFNLARTGRYEIYNPKFRRWHFRVAGEQLVFSHADAADGSSPAPTGWSAEPNRPIRRFERNRVRHLVISGAADGAGDLYNCARKLAPLMENTPGRSLFLGTTGHSVHDERPRFLARQIVSFVTVEARPSLGLAVLVHVQNKGDKTFPADLFAGTRGQGLRLEGFQVDFDPPVAGLGMEYKRGDDIAWLPAGRFLGMRGSGRPMETFAIRLTGPLAGSYDVEYMAHVQNIGDQPPVPSGEFVTPYKNGAFCGTRGLALEGIRVRVMKKG